jgi:hypothetical protein
VGALLTVLLTGAPIAQGALLIKTEKPHIAGQKAAIKLELENTFNEKIESVRASVFLFDDKGKMVGQATRWIIGGTRDKPALAPGARTSYDFVVSIQKPFSKTKLLVNRIVLEGRKLADVTTEVTVENQQ